MENNIQGSESWFVARLGRVTASKIADLTVKTKSGYSTSRANYMADLLIERLTGGRAEGFSSTSMVWGTETEPQARAAYYFVTDNEVTEVGFITHPTIDMSGASPDGFIGDDGLLEIKCPNTSTHIDFLLSGKIPEKYIKQMQWQMACTGRKWCDFVSFDPRLPINLQIKIIRVQRDDVFIVELENEVKLFLSELAEKVNKLKEL